MDLRIKQGLLWVCMLASAAAFAVGSVALILEPPTSHIGTGRGFERVERVDVGRAIAIELGLLMFAANATLLWWYRSSLTEEGQLESEVRKAELRKRLAELQNPRR